MMLRSGFEIRRPHAGNSTTQVIGSVSNLSSSGGDELMDALVSGATKPSETPHLRPEDLASSAVRAQMQLSADQGMHKVTLQKVYPAPGLFSCEVCKSEKVWHTEAQIQRGDEAMTVFLTCAECNHRFALDRGF